MNLIHVVDEFDALALITEGRVGEGRPAAVLTLIFVGRPLVLTEKAMYGPAPTGMVATTVLVAVLITETVLQQKIRHIGKGPIRIDSYSEWSRSNGHGGDHRIGCRVYHGDSVVATIRHIGKSPIRSDSYSYWESSDGYGGDHRVSRGAYYKDIGAIYIRHVGESSIRSDSYSS